MIKVLFVCLGNICRSPLAEAIFNHKVLELGLDKKLMAESAGTADYHIGDFPDPRAVEVASKHGVPMYHKGKQFKASMTKQFDYLIAMDHANFMTMSAVIGHAPDHLLLMRAFDADKPDSGVPDPYYGDMAGFQKVYDILDRSIDTFIEHLKNEHQLG